MIFRDDKNYYFSINIPNAGYLHRSLVQALHSINYDENSPSHYKNEATKLLTSFLYEMQNAKPISEIEQKIMAWETFNYPKLHPSKLTPDKDSHQEEGTKPDEA